MTAIVVQTRAWLCPDCDGYGAFDNGEHPNSPDYDERECIDCDGSGVIRASYSEGWDKGLQPWTGDRGRSAARVRIPHTDPLVWLAEIRNGPRRTASGEQTARFGYDYPGAFARALCRTNKPADRHALADRCDARINPWRQAA